jgi:hypothetical protein
MVRADNFADRVGLVTIDPETFTVICQILGWLRRVSEASTTLIAHPTGNHQRVMQECCQEQAIALGWV